MTMTAPARPLTTNDVPMWVNIRCECGRLLARISVDLYESQMASGKLELKCSRGECRKVTVFR